MRSSIDNEWAGKMNNICYAQGYIEKLRRMMENGTINSYKAVQMLDEEMGNDGPFREFYRENRIKIIDSLLR